MNKIINNKIITNVVITNDSYTNKYNIDALWDTGASGSIISEEYANNLGLTETGRTVEINGAFGSQKAREVLLNIYINDKGMSNLKFLVTPPIKGHNMIIGMNVILLGEFNIDNNIFTFNPY